MTYYTCTLHFGHEFGTALTKLSSVITSFDVADGDPDLDIPTEPRPADDAQVRVPDEVDAGQWTVPDYSDPLTKFCHWLDKANEAARVFADMVIPAQQKTFIGFEGGIQPHVHMITCLDPGNASMKLRKYNTKLKELMSNLWLSARLGFDNNQIKWKRTSKGTWANVNILAFLKNYFAVKPEWHKGPNSYNGFQAVIGTEIFEHACEAAVASTSQTTTNDPETLKLLSGLTSQAQEYGAIVKYLTDKGICTTEQMKHDEMANCLLLNKMATTTGSNYLEKMLTDVRSRISKQHKLSYFCTMHWSNKLYGTPDNFMTRCMSWNRIDPNQWCLLLYKWSNHMTGKKNCLVLRGPPSTGKTLIASSIAACSPSTGMVNKNNENFPFCACANRTLIWMEEGRLTQATIEEWKCISGGTKVAVDKKGSNQQVTIERTPVIWTTNSDPFLVYSGNMVTGEHTPALAERYFVVEMNTKLTADFWTNSGHYPTEEQSKQATAQCAKWGQVLSHSVSLLRDISNSLKQQPTFFQPQAVAEEEEEEAAEGKDQPDLAPARKPHPEKRRRSETTFHLLSPIAKRISRSQAVSDLSMVTMPGSPREEEDSLPEMDLRFTPGAEIPSVASSQEEEEEQKEEEAEAP